MADPNANAAHLQMKYVSSGCMRRDLAVAISTRSGAGYRMDRILGLEADDPEEEVLPEGLFLPQQSQTDNEDGEPGPSSSPEAQSPTRVSKTVWTDAAGGGATSPVPPSPRRSRSSFVDSLRRLPTTVAELSAQESAPASHSTTEDDSSESVPRLNIGESRPVRRPLVPQSPRTAHSVLTVSDLPSSMQDMSVKDRGPKQGHLNPEQHQRDSPRSPLSNRPSTQSTPRGLASASNTPKGYQVEVQAYDRRENPRQQYPLQRQRDGAVVPASTAGAQYDRYGGGAQGEMAAEYSNMVEQRAKWNRQRTNSLSKGTAKGMPGAQTCRRNGNGRHKNTNFLSKYGLSEKYANKLFVPTEDKEDKKLRRPSNLGPIRR